MGIILTDARSFNLEDPITRNDEELTDEDANRQVDKKL